MKHFSKIVFMILSVFAFALTTYNVMQAEETGAQAEETVVQTEGTGVQAEETSVHAEQTEQTEQTEQAAGLVSTATDAVSDSFHEVRFSDLYTEGSLVFDGFSPEVFTKDDMLTVSACRGDLNSGRIIIGKTFDN